MVTRVRIAGFLAASAMLVVACGSLVEPLPQSAGLTGTLPDQPGQDPLDPTVPVDPAAPIAGPDTTAPTTGSQAPSVPSAQDCRATKAAGVGVSKSEIKLGLIASLTGPLPGQFDSAVEAVDAYFKNLNETVGGICGRTVRLIIRDDNGDGATNLRIAQQLVEEEKIFAFVGSHSAPDDSGIAKVSKKHKVPDIGFPLTWERTENPHTYGVPGQVRRETIGHGATGSKYLNKALGIEQIAIFWLRESEVSILNAWAFEAAMIKTSGKQIRICHEQPSGVLDNNYTNYVVSMKGKCDPEVTAVYTTMENNANIKLAIAMRDQNFRPKAYVPTFSSYLQSFISQAQGSTEGAYIAMPQIPFERLQRPQSEWTPGTDELARYLSALQHQFPNHKPPGSFGAPAWGSAVLFTEAAAACGDDLTRACFFRQLDTMGPFSANGLLSPTTPSNHHIYTADLIVRVQNGRFVELRPNDKSGPRQAPDFWDTSTLFNWQKYFCANQELFPNADEKKNLIDEC